jgi:hypothetical protein
MLPAYIQTDVLVCKVCLDREAAALCVGNKLGVCTFTLLMHVVSMPALGVTRCKAKHVCLCIAWGSCVYVPNACCLPQALRAWSLQHAF